jgi:hypothetical protein
MILDSLLTFSGGLGAADSPYDAPTTGTEVAGNIIDLGVVLGIPSYANGGGARDIGVGDNPALKLSVRHHGLCQRTGLQLVLAGAWRCTGVPVPTPPCD